MKTALHYGLVLFLIAGIAGLGLSFVNGLTKEPIANAAKKALEEGQKLAFPAAHHFGPMTNVATDADYPGKEVLFCEAFNEANELIGWELLYTVGGYQSQIKVLTGLERKGKITAIKVLSQAETPGLGAEVDALPSKNTIWHALSSLFSAQENAKAEESLRPWFQSQFDGKELEDLEVVKVKDGKHIQAISGATITSVAVTKDVREPIEIFRKWRKAQKKAAAAASASGNAQPAKEETK